MKYSSLLILLLLIGCDSKPSASSKAELPPTPPIERTIELTDVTYAGLERAIADEKGKVVLIDLWATWCAPCMKEFPHLVELHEKYASKGLVCVSLSTDDAEGREKALAFLKVKEAHFANYRLSEKNTNISKELDAKFPTDSQPILFLFNRKGEKVATFEKKDERKLENIQAQIEKLLRE
ncbi:hypothetical protein BH11PLA2_BH11PLA2_39090 [soil metagenome]